MTMRTLAALSMFAAAAGAQSRPAAPRAPVAPLAFTHVAVVDVESGQLGNDYTVVISGNRITAVGPDVRVPSGARIIDARGKVLIPGLWDMHSHALDRWEWSSLLNVANGVTGVRDPGAVMPVPQIVRLRSAVERGEELGPRFVASGRIIDGTPKSRETYVAIDSPSAMRAEIAQRQQAGLDFIKVYTRLSRDAFMAAAAEAKRLNIPVAGHVPLSITAAEASDAGMRSIEHSYRHRMSCATAEDEIRRLLRSLPGIQQAGEDQRYVATEDSAFVLGLNTYSAEKCRALGERLARNGTWFVPTLVEMQTRFVDDYPLSDAFEQRFTDPRLRYVSPARVLRWRTVMALDAGVVQGQFSFGPRGPDSVFAERAREVANRLRMPADIQRGGGMLLAGTDVDNTFPFLFFGFSLHDELALLVKGGVTPLAALQSATINPARFLGRAHELGTVAQGKLADLVLLEANPLDRIEHTTRIAAVVVNGRYFSRKELDALLDRAAAIVRR
ncbi:MAG: amidohydrolase family protein [Gemmatimonadaceae bacterium]|jgi:imidazolonepropionase-like amidohydrolase|nr:amidohydrolase family protein [Gemmatimonadaceae bacterium]